MTVEVKISFASVPDMLAFFANTKTLAARPMEVAVEETPTPVELPAPAEKRGRGRPPKNSGTAQPEVASNTGNTASASPSASPLAEGSVVSEGAGEATSPAPDPAPSAPVTIDQARSALTKLNAAKGLEAAKEALTRYGAARMADLKEADYAPFVAYCEAASI